MKRKYPRVNSINLISTQQVHDEQLQEYGYLGATVNLSEGGVLFESKVPFPLLSIVKLSLTLQDQVMETVGRVVRLEETAEGTVEVAIHFTEISPEDLDALKLYIQAREEED